MHTGTSNQIRLITTLAILTVLLALASTVLAASETATNTEPAFVDYGATSRSESLSVPGHVTDVNISVDFQKIATEDCDSPYDDYDVNAYHSDLGLSLTSPSGTVVNLVYNDTHPGGPTHGDPTYNALDPVVDRLVVTYDDEAAQPVGGLAPTPGSFRPEEPLAAFDGEPAAGTWALEISDSFEQEGVCYYGFTLTVETDDGEPTPDPTGEPTPDLPAAPMSCTTGDDSLNARHCGRPVAIFAQNGGFSIYGVDINTGWGSLASTITAEQIDEVGVPADGPVVIAEGQNPYNFQPFTLYRLPSGEYQLNTFYWDGKPYAVKWEGTSPVQVVAW